MKDALIVASIVGGLLIALSCGGCNNPLDETPVKVRVVRVWSQKDYEESNQWSTTYPHTVVERLDTLERIRLGGCTWGTTGEVFSVKQCNLKW